MDASPPEPTLPIRTLKPRTTRWLLIGAALLALLLSAWAAHIYVSAEQDADLQQRIETLKRDGPPAEGNPPAPPPE